MSRKDDVFPCVSVVISTYERPVMLRRALDSVLAQTFKDYEVIVVHDGPASEETKAVFKEYSALFDEARIAVMFMGLEQNSGAQAWPKNVGTWHSAGDYIAYLDDDNEWTPDHLEVLVSAMEEGEDWPDFVYGRRLYMKDGAFQGHEKCHEGESPFVPFDAEAIARLASPKTNFIDTSDFLVAKGALWRLQAETGAMWNVLLNRFGDWDLLSRLVVAVGARGRAVDKVVQIYHWTGENIQLTRPYVQPTTMSSAEYELRKELEGGEAGRRFSIGDHARAES